MGWEMANEHIPQDGKDAVVLGSWIDQAEATLDAILAKASECNSIEQAILKSSPGSSVNEAAAEFLRDKSLHVSACFLALAIYVGRKSIGNQKPANVCPCEKRWVAMWDQQF
jgi:hypothetical protein